MLAQAQESMNLKTENNLWLGNMDVVAINRDF